MGFPWFGEKKTEKTLTNNLKVLSEKVFETLMETDNQCKVTGTVVQSNEIVVGISPELMKACALFPDATIEGCARATRADGIMISDVSNDASIDVSANCSFTEDMTQKFNGSLAAKMTNKQDLKSDEMSKAIQDLINTMGGSDTKTSLNNSSIVEDVFKQTFTTKTINSMIQDYTITQRNIISVSNAKGSTISGIRNLGRIKVVYDAVSKNKRLIDSMSKVTSDSDSKQTSEEKGFASVFAGLFDTIKSVFKGMSLAYIASIAGVVVVVVAGMFVLPSMMSGGGDASVPPQQMMPPHMMPPHMPQQMMPPLMPQQMMPPLMPPLMPQQMPPYIPSPQNMTGAYRAMAPYMDSLRRFARR